MQTCDAYLRYRQDFEDTAGSVVRATVMLNQTTSCSRWRQEECAGRVKPIRHLATLNAVLRGAVAEAAAESMTDNPLMAGVRQFPPGAPWGQTFDLGSVMGPFLFAFTFMVLFPSVVVTLVQEKVFKIRIMMRMMGLSGTAFWSITYAFWLCIFWCFTSVFLLIVNVARLHTSGYRIGMFANVDGGVQVMFFLGYVLCTISFAFLWSTLIRTIRVAQVMAVLWIVVLVVLAFVFDSVGDIFNSDGVSAGMKTFLTLFPPLGLYRGLAVFRQFASTFDSPNVDGSKLSWSSVNGTAIPEILTVQVQPFACYGFLLALCMCERNTCSTKRHKSDCGVWQFLESVVFMVLALYLDQVLHADFGVPRHPVRGHLFLHSLKMCSAIKSRRC